MKIAWEYGLVEKPFCEQLRLIGWEWLEGDTDVPELTERANFREVLLRDRLRAAPCTTPPRSLGLGVVHRSTAPLNCGEV